jgi:hypothetical protein
MKIPYHSRFGDSTQKTVEWPAGIQGVSNLWVLLWVWLSKMNNVASSNSFPTSESSFCPSLGFARDFVVRTWSGDRESFLSVLESEEDLENQSWNKSSNSVKPGIFGCSLLLSRSPWLWGQDSVKIRWFAELFPGPLYFVIF